MRVPETADREFTASAYVVREGRVLLIRHAKLGRWVQPGGHVEAPETPDEAAIREVEEETGVSMAVHGDYRPPSDRSGSAELPEPFRINLHRVRDGHWHCDFAFLGVARALGRPRSAGEHDSQRWLSPADLATLSPVDDETRRTAEAAIREVEERCGR